MESNWIESLKVGDKVAVSRRYSTMIGTVQAVNKATVKVDGILYNKVSGRERTSDAWMYSTILKVTPEIEKKIFLESLQIKTYNRMKNLPHDVLSWDIDKLKEVNEFLDKIEEYGRK